MVSGGLGSRRCSRTYTWKSRQGYQYLNGTRYQYTLILDAEARVPGIPEVALLFYID